MKDSKNLVIGMLCAVVCIMAVAYAAFSTTLNVTTTATVASNWCVQIASTTCEAHPVAGAATDSATASANPTTAGLSTTISMNFSQPGDYAICTVTYENCGSLAAAMTHEAFAINPADGEVIEELTISNGTATYKLADNGIQFTISGLMEETLNAKTAEANGGTMTVTVRGDFLNVEAGQSNPTTKTASIKVSSSANQAV